MHDLNNRGIQTIGYHGQVTTKVVNRQKTLATYSTHNSGSTKLFRGLCSVLLGESSRDIPDSVALFSFNPAVSELASYYNLSWEQLCQTFFTDKSDNQIPVIQQVSPNLPINAKQLLMSSNGAPVADFQFVVPYNLIASSMARDSMVYFYVLYPKQSGNKSLTAEDALAVYKLANAAGWNPINVDSSRSDYKLLIDWQMDFNNVAATDLATQ